MNATQRTSELQALLEGIALPATREELLDYAAGQQGGEGFRGDLESLPEREFRSLDEVAEELVRVQPQAAAPRVAVPHEESDEPPGGEAYTDPNAEPGAVRPDWPEENPPHKVVDEQAKTQKTQQQRQQQAG